MRKMSEGRKADTIYMGGGTPTTLNADQLDRLLTCIDRHFVREGLLEFTVEAGRPDSITKEKLQVLRNHGINRFLSILRACSRRPWIQLDVSIL